MLRKCGANERVVLFGTAYNQIADAVNAWQSRQLDQSRGQSPRGGDGGIIFVKNDSGAARNRFDVMGIDTPLFTPTAAPDTFKKQVIVNGVTPTTASHTGKFVILLEPVKAGGIAPAIACGVTPATVNVVAEADGFADVNDGVPGSLKSGAMGAAQILWKESGTGNKWALVRLGGRPVGGRTPFKLTTKTGGAGYYGTEQVPTWAGVELSFNDKEGANPLTVIINLFELDGSTNGHIDVSNTPIVMADSLDGGWVIREWPTAGDNYSQPTKQPDGKINMGPNIYIE